MLSNTDKFLLGFVLFVTICAFVFSFHRQFSNISAESKSEFTHAEISEAERNKNGKTQLAEYSRAERPNEFLLLHNALRTRHNETVPGYRQGYRGKELEKARNNVSATRIQAINFVERGPANVPGRTRSLVVDPDDITHQTWFAGAVGGGIWKTTNAGASWSNKTGSQPNLAISSLVMASSNHNMLYAGTGEGWGASGGFIKGSGIFKSTDRGQTWSLLPSTIGNNDFQMVNRIIVDPNNENIVLAATSNDPLNATSFTSGIFKSIDGGGTWTKKFSSPSWSQQLVANPDNFNTIYAAVRGFGIWKSVDAGETWVESGAGINPDGRIEIDISPVDTSRLFASVQGSLSGNGSDLYISDDGAATWTLLTEINAGMDEDFLGGQGWYNNTVLADPFDADVVYVGGVNLWRFTVQPGSQVVNDQFIGATEQNTTDFMTLVNFGAKYYGGRIDPGDETAETFVSVEVRFGPDAAGGHLHQMAHRFTVPDGQGSGVPAINYSYQDYVEVPFEVWDVTNNRQLMVSFRDQQKDSIFNLLPLLTDNADWANNSREYIFISALDYNPAAPDTIITKNGGQEARELYFFWPHLSGGAVWDETSLPDSKFIISIGDIVKRFKLTSNVSDAYNEFESTNNFQQITGSISVIGLHPDHHSLVPIIHDTNTGQFQIINTNDGGVFLSNVSTSPGINNGDWTSAGNGYNTSQFYAVDKAPGESRYVGGLQDNGSWMSQPGQEGSATAVYQRANGGDGFGVVWNYQDPNKILTSSPFNDVDRSLNGGSSFSLATTDLIDKGSTFAPFITKLENAKNDPDVVFAIGSRGVWRTNDFASNWSVASITDQWSLGAFADVKISKANTNIVWAGSAMISTASVTISLHVSVDGGTTFSPASNFTDVFMGQISGLATHPTLDSTAFALFSFAEGPKILRTDDLGRTWFDISGFGMNKTSDNGFPDIAIYDLLVMPFDPSMIWVGTEIGIFESVDDGASWHILNANMPAASVWEMSVVDDQVVLATHGRGIWSVSITELPPHSFIPSIIYTSTSLAGELLIKVETPSPYDSMFLFIDNNLFAKLIQPSGIGQVELITNYNASNTGEVIVKAFANGLPLVSHPFGFDLFSYNTVVDTYENDFTTTTDDFYGSGFSEQSFNSFTSRAIHSDHPVNANSISFYMLKTPIRVKSQNALINFKEVVIVEPGPPGAFPGTPEFRDFVVVQGSKDGVTWLDLTDQYDASQSFAWTSAFNSSNPGSTELFRFKSIDMLNTFQAGDTVLFRFFIRTNASNSSWGWVIDDLKVQTIDVITGISDEVINTEISIYPNPVTNDHFTIRLDNPSPGEVQFSLIDLNGRVISSNNFMVSNTNRTEHSIQLPSGLRNGIYHLRIQTDKSITTLKLLVHH